LFYEHTVKLSIAGLLVTLNVTVERGLKWDGMGDMARKRLVERLVLTMSSAVLHRIPGGWKLTIWRVKLLWRQFCNASLTPVFCGDAPLTP
jgi:hypothetical protein